MVHYLRRHWQLDEVFLTGGSHDRGVDFRGRWGSILIVGQCKSHSKPVAAGLLAQFEATLEKEQPRERTVGIFVAERMSLFATRYFHASKLPMCVICASAERMRSEIQKRKDGDNNNNNKNNNNDNNNNKDDEEEVIKPYRLLLNSKFQETLPGVRPITFIAPDGTKGWSLTMDKSQRSNSSSSPS